MKKTKTQKGITLVALIITIIVLLILAVVTINAVKGDGIIQYANDAAYKYNQAATNEQAMLDSYLSKIPNSDTEKVTWTKTSEGNLAVGSTVATNTGENFYVISFKDDDETAILLAKDNIHTNDLVQSTSANKVAFCEESAAGYWGNGNGATNYDIVENEQPIPSTHTAAYAADRYGAKLGVTGRLMLNGDVSENVSNDIIYGTNGAASSPTTVLEYWKGVAWNASMISTVWNDTSAGGEPTGMPFNYSTANTFGVRPVVEVPTDLIS